MAGYCTGGFLYFYPPPTSTLFTSVVPNYATKAAILLGFRIVVQKVWNLVRFDLKTLMRFILAAGDYGKDKVMELIELVILKFLTIATNSAFLS